MKKTSLLGICLAAAVGAAVALGIAHFADWGRDRQPAIGVSSTPVNRDARSGTSYAPVVKKAAPSVVNIFTTRFIKERPNPFQNDPFFRQFFGARSGGPRKEQSLGSGVIVSADGYILTANHVVAEADEIKVAVPGNKNEFIAKVIGKDSATDVAVLKISATGLPAVTLADSDQLEVGDTVLALGNPFGIGQTVTMGIVSALGRSGLGINGYENFIQTDAAINKGNSGGALVDAEGRLIGINTAIISPNGSSSGIGLAVPINLARNVLERLIAGGKVTRGYLGILQQDVDAGLAQQFHLPGQNGALVGDVIPDSPAQKAGLKSGDVILSVNGKEISDAHDLQLTVSQLLPGSKVLVKYFRNGAEKILAATLGELPGEKALPENHNDSNADTGNADMLDGVQVAEPTDVAQLRQYLRIPPSFKGAIVTEVGQASNAAEAGLQPNDLIVEVNHQPVSDSDEAVRLCKASHSSQILLKVWRHFGDVAGTRYLNVDNNRRTK